MIRTIPQWKVILRPYLKKQRELAAKRILNDLKHYHGASLPVDNDCKQLMNAISALIELAGEDVG